MFFPASRDSVPKISRRHGKQTSTRSFGCDVNDGVKRSPADSSVTGSRWCACPSKYPRHTSHIVTCSLLMLRPDRAAGNTCRNGQPPTVPRIPNTRLRCIRCCQRFCVRSVRRIWARRQAFVRRRCWSFRAGSPTRIRSANMCLLSCALPLILLVIGSAARCACASHARRAVPIVRRS